MPRVGPRKQRARGAGHGDAHPRLQHGVALDHPLEGGIDDRQVERMQHDADQLARRIPGQLRVGIEGEAEAHGRQQLDRPDPGRETGVGGAAQQAIEFLELAALALPPHPHLLARVPQPIAVEQEEARAVFGGEPRVQRLDALAGRGQHHFFAGYLRLVGVVEVRQQRKVDVGIEVADGDDLEVFETVLHVVDRREQGRHHHHRPRIVGDPAGQIQAGQAPRRHRQGDQALGDGQREVARRNGEEQGGDRHDQRRGAGVARVPESTGDQQERERRDRAKVDAGGVAQGEAAEALREFGSIRQVDLKAFAALAHQVIADMRRGA